MILARKIKKIAISSVIAGALLFSSVAPNAVLAKENYDSVSELAASQNSTSTLVKASVNKLSDSGTWAEYNYSITNGTSKTITAIKITIPTTGTITSFQCWGMNATYSSGNIVITHSANIKAGDSYSCTNDAKMGFSGGGKLGTPKVTFEYGTAATSNKLKYKVAGRTKNLSKSKTPFGIHGKLSLKTVKGYSSQIIVDKNGDPFQLRGASTHGIQWNEMSPYVNKKAFHSLRDEWGVNTIRIAGYVTQGGYVSGGDAVRQKMESTFEKGVKAATDLGMYVIIDWHIHQENPWDYQNEAKAFFKKYAAKYKNNSHVIFEICNEPVGVSWYNGSGRDLYSYAKSIVKVIRGQKNNNLIICGTNTWSQDVDEVARKPLKADGFKNILYTFHFYSGSHYQDLMNKVKTAYQAKVPIFVTEFGICDASGNGNFDTANADAWIKLCDSYNISYCCWSLCNKNESASYLKPSCNKYYGWKASNLARTGIWLVNTYRKHQDEEKVRSIKVTGNKTISAVKVGYADPGKTTLTIKNNGSIYIKNLTVKLKSGSNFVIKKGLSSKKLGKGKKTKIEISLKTGKKAGTYTDTVIVKTAKVIKKIKISQTVTK